MDIQLKVQKEMNNPEDSCKEVQAATQGPTQRLFIQNTIVPTPEEEGNGEKTAFLFFFC